MHRFFTTTALIFTLTNLAQAFDQLPPELLEKIILMEPAAIGALSSTCQPINTLCRSWAHAQGKDVATVYLKNTPQYVYFMLKHNNNITECDVAEYIKCKISDYLVLRATSAVYPWMKQKENYEGKSCSSTYHYWCIKPVNYGFLMPICYRRGKAMPMMHYFAKQFSPGVLHETFELLLKSGANPYCKCEDKTVFDIINELTGFDQPKKKLITLCEKYKREPIDSTVVIYWQSKAFTIADVDTICSSSNQ
jgi:hypothetical protein